MVDYSTFQIGNNVGADQTAQMCRLIRTFVVCMQQSPFYSPSRSISSWPGGAFHYNQFIVLVKNSVDPDQLASSEAS